ncbi:MAG: fibronectin type III domain-containing protein [Chloroflexi bacterium]|nr:fibronectin type III domain-containing protein [Chloroflexota bacterium]
MGTRPGTFPRARGRAILAVLLASALSLGFGRPVAWTLAFLGDTETVVSTFSTETLDPPTNLNATAALFLTVNLTWTATVDVRATGYEVLRSTTSGSGYAVIATVTPRTSTAYTDLPLVPGTYYYVLRSYYDSWTSVNSNEDSAVAL